jgi:hypothetical protein
MELVSSFSATACSTAALLNTPQPRMFNHEPNAVFARRGITLIYTIDSPVWMTVHYINV